MGRPEVLTSGQLLPFLPAGTLCVQGCPQTPGLRRGGVPLHLEGLWVMKKPRMAERDRTLILAWPGDLHFTFVAGGNQVWGAEVRGVKDQNWALMSVTYP